MAALENTEKKFITITDVRAVSGDSAFLIDDGKTAILYDTGFAFTGLAVIENIKKVLGDRPLDYILLTHSHYDHVLGVPSLLAAYPNVKVVAGVYAARIFTKASAKATMCELNRKAAEKHGFIHYIPLTFIKNYSPQVLKANMRICGATEYAILFYRGYLPKFRNHGRMVFNWFTWQRDNPKDYPKIHPAQKPVAVLKNLIEIFTDPGDVVIDPCAGSGTTLRAALELDRNSYGFEIDKNFYNRATNEMLKDVAIQERMLLEVM